MKTRTVAGWLIGWLWAAQIATVCGSTIIDDFSVGAFTKIANTPNYNSGIGQTGLDTARVLIGQRSLTLQGDMVSGSVEATVDTTGSGQLRYVPHAPVFSTNNTFNRDFGGRIILSYLPGSRGTAYDFATLAPGNAFAIDVSSADFGAKGTFRGQIGMNGYDALGVFTLHNSPTPYTIVVPFSSMLINPATTTVRSLNFDFMDLDYSGIPGSSTFALDAIRVVPEPSGLMLSVAACLVLATTSGWHAKR